MLCSFTKLWVLVKAQVVVGTIHFLGAVELMVAIFFKVKQNFSALREGINTTLKVLPD